MRFALIKIFTLLAVVFQLPALPSCVMEKVVMGSNCHDRRVAAADGAVASTILHCDDSPSHPNSKSDAPHRKCSCSESDTPFEKKGQLANHDFAVLPSSYLLGGVVIVHRHPLRPVLTPPLAASCGRTLPLLI